MLHRLFSRFDAAVARRGSFKMDTVRAPVAAVRARARGGRGAILHRARGGYKRSREIWSLAGWPR